MTASGKKKRKECDCEQCNSVFGNPDKCKNRIPIRQRCEELDRYAQPCFTHNGWNKDGEPFKITEVPLIKIPDGKYVLFSDVEALLQSYQKGINDERNRK